MSGTLQIKKVGDASYEFIRVLANIDIDIIQNRAAKANEKVHIFF